MGSLRIRLFGTLEVCLGDDIRPRSLTPLARSFFAYLIYHHDRFIPRHRLLGIFWGDRAEEHGRRALSHTLWQIRQCGTEVNKRLIPEADAVCFRLLEQDVLDVERFEALCKPASISVPLIERIHRLEEAVAIYRADFLEDIYDDWVLLERERLRERYLQCLETLTTLHKRRGAYNLALDTAHRLIAADPLREATHREVMRLYHLLGRPRAALQQFQRLRKTLADELNAQPTATTQSLYREIAASLEDVKTPYLPIEVAPPLLGDLSHLPFVGRSEERGQLLHALKAALQGHGGLVIVRGAAGVGKSRLVGELIADAEWRGFQIGLAKVSPLGAVPPYQLLREALASLLTPLRISQLAEIVERRWLSALAPLFPSIAEQVPNLPPLPPLDLHAEWQRLWDALGHTLRALASITPLLLVLEDVHWADNASLAAIPHLAQYLGDAPVLLVLTSRIVEAHERPLVLETLEAVGRNAPLTRITLPPFTSEEINTLLHRALVTEPEHAATGAFAERLKATTEGNALHLLEILKLFFEQGVLIQEQTGRWTFPETTMGLETRPGRETLTSVKKLVEDRVLRMPPATREVLESVAVLGEDAEFRVLTATEVTPSKELSQHLEQLEQRGFLRQTETGYRFEHDLLQDAVYWGLTPNRRRMLHAQAAVTLEKVRPDHTEAIAHHFWAGEIWDKALVYNHQAGQQAHTAYAGTEALTYYERALSAWKALPNPDPEVGLQLYRERSKLYDDLGHLDEAESDCQAAYVLAEQTDNVGAQAALLNALSYLQYERGHFRDAEATCGKALAKAEAAVCEPEIALGLFHRANAVRNQGRYTEAIADYQRAVAAFETLNNQARLADTLNRMGYALEITGAYTKARTVMERALAIRRQLDDKIGISYSLINLFAHHYYHGHFEDALHVIREAADICQAIGHPSGEYSALHGLGMIATEKGDLDTALPYFERAYTLAQEFGDLSMLSNVLAEMGRLFYFGGDLQKAREHLEEAWTTTKVSVEEHQLPGILAPLAQVCLRQGDLEKARVYAETALDVARRQQSPWNLALVYRVMGELVVLSDEMAMRPEEHFETSIRLFQEIDSEAEMARSMNAYAEYLLRPDARDTERGHAFSLIQQVQAIYQQKGMRGDLRRLEDLLTSHSRAGQIHIDLSRAGAPTGRPLTDEETVEVTWTVTAPEDDEITGKVARRRHRIRRLLREASEQSAEATVNDLAQALDVSARTIKRDLAALRAAGHDVSTRGSRNI